MEASISGAIYTKKDDVVCFSPGTGGAFDGIQVLTDDSDNELWLFMSRGQSLALLRGLIEACPGEAEDLIVEAGVDHEYLKERIAEEVS